MNDTCPARLNRLLMGAAMVIALASSAAGDFTCSPPCCPPQRITLASTPGTVQGSFTCGVFQPIPTPAGVEVVLDVGPPDGTCRHALTVAALTVPTFPTVPLNYCSQVTTRGCEAATGGKLGAGQLWDAAAPAGAAQTNVLVSADTRDGVCDTTGGACAAAPGNILGDVDVTQSPSAGGGVRATFATRVRSLTWLEHGCVPNADPACVAGDVSACCCHGSVFGDEAGDLRIADFDTIVWPTTNVAAAQFADKNGDGCSLLGAGPAGPVTAQGSPPPGPCCHVGQTATFVMAGAAMTGGTPQLDSLYLMTAPLTIVSCDGYEDGSCTVSTDPCDL